MRPPRKRALFALCLLLLALNWSAQGGMVISEFLAENAGGLKDEDGETPDWIELYNSGTNTVSLAGWHLTDTPTNLTRWTVPATNVPSGGYLVVFASWKNRAISGKPLHTNFRLESSGGYLALVEPDGNSIAHDLSYPAQRANVSQGLTRGWATVMRVDCNDDDSGETGASNTVNGFEVLTLTANPLTIGGSMVTISPIGGAALDDRDRAVPVPSAQMTQSQLYDDVIFSTGTTNGAGIRVDITGLTPSQTYTLKVWSVDPGASTAGDRLSDWIETASGTNRIIRTNYAWNTASPPVKDDDNTFGATVVASSSGTLRIEGRRSGGVSTTVDLNAFELSELGGPVIGDGNARFFTPPTPGSANQGGYLGLVADTTFSVDRGFYETPFEVAIATSTPEAQVYYTTDGSAPSLTNGASYSGPVPVSGTTLLRAAAFRTNWVPSDVDTQSYLFLAQVLQQPAALPGYPTVWQGSYPADYAMDPEIVYHPVYGSQLSNAFHSLPVLSLVMSHNDLWGASAGIYNHATSIGPAWERAGSAELFEPGGGTRFAVNCGVEMQGNASRDNARTPKHSFRLVFKNEYGPTRLSHDWFPGPVKEFNTLVLRAGGFCDGWPSRYSDTNLVPGTSLRGVRYRPENATYLKDRWVKETLRDMGQPAARSDYVNLFINGLYWGFYNPSERIDAAFAASHFGGREEDWDVIAGDENYDVIEVRDGNRLDWDLMMGVAHSGLASAAVFTNLSAMVDLENLADYMITHIFMEAEDWPHHNWYAVHRRATNGLPATRWQFLAWDQEIGMDRYVRRDKVNVGNTNTPARVYSLLRTNTEFQRIFGDQVHRHLTGQGTLTASNAIARFERLAGQLHAAMVGESARWGDARKTPIGANPGTGVTFTRDEWWLPELQALYEFISGLPEYNLLRYRTNSLYPTVDAPLFSQHGGAVAGGFQLSISHPFGDRAIYYTVNGDDPRTYLVGGIAAAARNYDGPIGINGPTRVRARALLGLQWSALMEADFYPPQDLSQLRLTEIMYNPLPAGVTNEDAFEFIEMQNAGADPLNLSGLTFSQGITFTFTNGTLLDPGHFLVLARDAGGFSSRYPGIPVAGLYSGRLDNDGEPLTLTHPAGATVFSVSYGHRAPWPVAADGSGFSLVQSTAVGQAPDEGSAWRASTQVGGSPGVIDPTNALPKVVINEILAHTDPPQVDAVELYNPSGALASVGNWYLTDDPGTPMKYRLPGGTSMAPGTFLVVTADSFNANPGSPTNFSLSSVGDQVYLFSADSEGRLTGYSHGFEFGPSFNGSTLGRILNEVGEEFLLLQQSPSLSQTNIGPRTGPVVINEIHYNPAGTDVEFVELLNITATNVLLYDPLHTTNSWKLGGVDFTFPAWTSIGPNGYLVVGAGDPDQLRARYNIAPEVPVLGWMSGTLQNSGENLQLLVPDVPNLDGTVPCVAVEELRYNDKAPWSPAADGSGLSLQRVNPLGLANSPANWVALGPTPGRSGENADADGDGLPDAWEAQYGTQPLAADAGLDLDGDGMTNGQEYLAGTNPASAASQLRVEVAALGSQVRLEFLAVSNRTYSVMVGGTLPNPGWARFVDIPAHVTNRWVTVEAPSGGPEPTFFRLITPAMP